MSSIVFNLKPLRAATPHPRILILAKRVLIYGCCSIKHVELWSAEYSGGSTNLTPPDFVLNCFLFERPRPTEWRTNEILWETATGSVRKMNVVEKKLHYTRGMMYFFCIFVYSNLCCVEILGSSQNGCASCRPPTARSGSFYTRRPTVLYDIVFSREKPILYAVLRLLLLF